MRADTPYELQIEADFHAMWRHLRTIEPPPGHRWSLQAGDPLRWFMESIERSTRFGVSIVLCREIEDWHDDRQLNAHVRISWDEVGQIGRGALPETRRAIVWCEMGPRVSWSATSLLGDRARFLAAPDIDRLFAQTRDALEPALSLYQDRLAQARISDEPAREVVRSRERSRNSSCP